MPITHTLEYGVYHWDTFDDTTILVDEAKTLSEAKKKVQDHYGSRLEKGGADQVNIVDSLGNVLESYNVG